MPEYEFRGICHDVDDEYSRETQSIKVFTMKTSLFTIPANFAMAGGLSAPESCARIAQDGWKKTASLRRSLCKFLTLRIESNLNGAVLEHGMCGESCQQLLACDSLDRAWLSQSIKPLRPEMGPSSTEHDRRVDECLEIMANQGVRRARAALRAMRSGSLYAYGSHNTGIMATGLSFLVNAIAEGGYLYGHGGVLFDEPTRIPSFAPVRVPNGTIITDFQTMIRCVVAPKRISCNQ